MPLNGFCESRCLTRTATLGNVEDASCLIDDIVSQIRCNLGTVLQENSIDPVSIVNLDSVISESYTRPFIGLQTFYN